MKYLKNNTLHTLKLEKGDVVFEEITNYATLHGIKFAKVQMFGAVSDVTIGFLLETGEYKWKKIEKESLELLPCMGSLAWDGEKLELHMHGSFTDEDFIMYGGHIKEMKIFGVGEVYITELSNKKVSKKLDPATNLKLWDLE